MKISEAKIYFNDNNTPTSSEFNDVYFSNDNGVLETDYVFVSGNNLLSRWFDHNSDVFTIAETGFGTGLNFFRSLQLFYWFRQEYPEHPLTTLSFISTEKYPLKKSDAKHIIKSNLQAGVFDAPYCYTQSQDVQLKLQLPELTSTFQDWLGSYPKAIAGIHRREFNLLASTKTQHQAITSGKVILDLCYGDALASFKQLRVKSQGLVDAWFLDGFAPSKNEGLWQDSLFEEIARLSAKHATLATFTAAGAVKRGLQNLGFDMKKQKGFGKKREMLIGQLSQKAKSVNNFFQPPYYCRHNVTLCPKQTSNVKPKTNAPKPNSSYTKNADTKSSENSTDTEQKIAIVGGGIAGAILAHKLTQRGYYVDLIWPYEALADGASGNPIAGFYPQLNAQYNTASQIHLHSFLYARHYYEQVAKIQPFEHKWCGALQIAFNENTQTRLKKIEHGKFWPREIAHTLEPKQATAIANVDIPYNALFLPDAGWLSPPSLVNACVELALQSKKLTLIANTRLKSYCSVASESTVKLNLQSLADNTKSQNNKAIRKTKYRSLILAMGSELPEHCEGLIPFSLTRGQIEMCKSHEDFAQLSTLLCHKGYFTPANKGFHAFGSSYIKNDTSTEIRKTESEHNFALQANCLNKTHWIKSIAQDQVLSSSYARAAIRCSTPDHLPVVGAMPSHSQFDELHELYKALPLQKYPVPSVQNNVFVLSGLGSRGLTSAPLMAELLISQMLGQNLPLPQTLADALMPNRFIVRALIKREAL